MAAPDWPPSEQAQDQAVRGIIHSLCFGRHFGRVIGIMRAIAAIYRQLPRPLQTSKWKQLAQACQRQYQLPVAYEQLKHHRVSSLLCHARDGYLVDWWS